MSQDAVYFNVWFSACYMRLRERLSYYDLDEDAFHDTYLLVREKALCSVGGIADFEAYFRACYRHAVLHRHRTPRRDVHPGTGFFLRLCDEAAGSALRVKPVWAPARNRTSAGGILPYASACGCLCWRRRCSSSCWVAGWVSAGLSELKKEAAAQYLCSSLLLAGRIYHFGTPEHLRTLRRTIFTGNTSAPTGLSCCAD